MITGFILGSCFFSSLVCFFAFVGVSSKVKESQDTVTALARRVAQLEQGTMKIAESLAGTQGSVGKLQKVISESCSSTN